MQQKHVEQIKQSIRRDLDRSSGKKREKRENNKDAVRVTEELYSVINSNIDILYRLIDRF